MNLERGEERSTTFIQLRFQLSENAKWRCQIVTQHTKSNKQEHNINPRIKLYSPKIALNNKKEKQPSFHYTSVSLSNINTLSPLLSIDKNVVQMFFIFYINSFLQRWNPDPERRVSIFDDCTKRPFSPVLINCKFILYFLDSFFSILDWALYPLQLLFIHIMLRSDFVLLT